MAVKISMVVFCVVTLCGFGHDVPPNGTHLQDHTVTIQKTITSSVPFMNVFTLLVKIHDEATICNLNNSPIKN